MTPTKKEFLSCLRWILGYGALVLMLPTMGGAYNLMLDNAPLKFKEDAVISIRNDADSLVLEREKFINFYVCDETCRVPPRKLYRETYKVVNGKIKLVRADTAKLIPAHTVPEKVVWP